MKEILSVVGFLGFWLVLGVKVSSLEAGFPEVWWFQKVKETLLVAGFSEVWWSLGVGVSLLVAGFLEVWWFPGVGETMSTLCFPRTLGVAGMWLSVTLADQVPAVAFWREMDDLGLPLSLVSGWLDNW